ncbi:hypothetical protein CALVIDRAFT_561520 [Calocera viscosa TUFC12733]|uniref:Uncharacterized protein n=1 Tax=Calocera viscosa (strain TUFC12733) TaxID=1330018 RepID=A0A167PTS8_CALVF|nr:hypothetical protein CALVIDRAFT_561520 [Calocera viscosa TUFC12733]
MSTSYSLRRALLLVAFYALGAHAWSFSIQQQPETCTAVTLSWSGGVPPYTITFLHPSNALASFDNISSWSDGASAIYNLDGDGGAGFGMSQAGFTPLIIIGSDATGFGSGGTSQVLSVVPSPTVDEIPCPVMASNTSYLTYLQAFTPFYEITQCGTVTATHNGSLAGIVYVDTIVPLGQSFRTVLNASASTELSWQLPVSAGTNLAFAFSLPGGADYDQSLFITPLMTVQPGNDTCQAEGTLSSAMAMALPTGMVGINAAGSGRAGMGALLGVMVAVSAAVMLEVFSW